VENSVINISQATSKILAIVHTKSDFLFKHFFLILSYILLQHLYISNALTV